MITTCELFKEAIDNNLITNQFSFLIYISQFQDEGVTASDLTKYFKVSYPHASKSVKEFREKEYVELIKTHNKRDKKVILTKKTYDLFKLIGGL